jgi:hypothetical protein
MKKVLVAVMALTMMFVTSCKEYQEDIYATATTNESVFVVPLEASAKAGAKLTPAEYDKHKVMAKKIQIPTRWHNTGRMWFNGHWVETVKVLKVDRTPISTNWLNGITVESQDSIDFAMSFNCTAEIYDADSALFLSRYMGGTLKAIIDREVRNHVQGVVSSVTSKYDMDELRSKKGEIATTVKSTVIPFFKERGITITTLDMSSGFNYTNQKIQQSLDAIVIVQQEKAEEKAKLSAMADRIKRITAEGKAEADAKVQLAEGKASELIIVRNSVAEGLLIDETAKAEALLISAKSLADAKIVTATADAKEIELQITALTQAGKSSDYLKLKQLDVDMAKVNAWAGGVPMIQGGNAPQQFIDVSDVLPKLVK